MKKINIYYWNNGVGIVNHAILLKHLLSDFVVTLCNLSDSSVNHPISDLGIFIQNTVSTEFDKNKKNVLLLCEEWLSEGELKYITQLDHLIVASQYAKDLLNVYHTSVFNTGFFSLDKYFFPKNTGKILNFKGKSIQKNHELCEKYKKDFNITIQDSEQSYLSDNEISTILNTHDIHICCSLYESWGHYLWEAMSCGKLVICSEIPIFKEYVDPNLVKFIPIQNIVEKDINHRFLKETIFPFRKGYFINEFILKETLQHKEELLEFQIKNSTNIRQHFLDVNYKNKNKFLNLIKYLI